MKRIAIMTLAAVLLLWPVTATGLLCSGVGAGTLLLIVAASACLWPLHMLSVLVASSIDDRPDAKYPVERDVGGAMPRPERRGAEPARAVVVLALIWPLLAAFPSLFAGQFGATLIKMAMSLKLVYVSLLVMTLLAYWDGQLARAGYLHSATD